MDIYLVLAEFDVQFAIKTFADIAATEAYMEEY